MRSPSIIHQPFPISQITPSTIVLGSSFYNEDSDTSSVTSPTMQPSNGPALQVDTAAAAAAPAQPANESMATHNSSQHTSPITHINDEDEDDLDDDHENLHTSASHSSSEPKSALVASLEEQVGATISSAAKSRSHSGSGSGDGSIASAHYAKDGDTDDDTEHTKDPNLEGETETEAAEVDDQGNPIIAIPFSNKHVEASSVLVTSNDPPERCTSPRRDNSAIERIGREKVHVLRKEAQLMQDSLTDILDRIVQVRDEYDRLSGENKFLQDYIGNLMATSNILNKN